jgi:hypothetical protein
MNDVVERVARAIAAEMNRSGPIASKAVARAAVIETLKSLREPSLGMMEAANRHANTLMPSPAVFWQVVIDAALADASPDIGKEGIGNDG